MEEIKLDVIEKKMDIIIRLLASLVLIDKNQTESILALDQIGLEINEIAAILGTTQATVRTRIWEANSKTKKTNK